MELPQRQNEDRIHRFDPTAGRIRQSAHRHECQPHQEGFDKPAISQPLRPHMGGKAASLARDVSPIFHAIGAKYPHQREVIFPRGCQFVLAEPPRQLRVVRGGQILRVPYLVLHEV